MRSHKGITRTLILGIVLLSVVACNEADGTESTTNPHFPQMREDPTLNGGSDRGRIGVRGRLSSCR